MTSRKASRREFRPEPSRHRLKATARGDPRPYLKTNVGVMPGLPQHDEHKPGVIYWCGKRLYVGHKTQMARLFYLLAERPGRWHPITEIQDVVFKLRTDPNFGLPDHEIRRQHQRLRKVVSKLKKRMQEDDLDDHAIIVAVKTKDRGSGYVLLLYQEQKYQKGEAPWPPASKYDLDDDE